MTPREQAKACILLRRWSDFADKLKAHRELRMPLTLRELEAATREFLALATAPTDVTRG